jgi:hypothetical protein
MTARHLLVLCFLLAVLVAGLTFAGDDEPTSSKTATALAGVDAETQRQPPVRLFAAWLDAFNSGDPERYDTFLKRKFPFRATAFGDDLELRRLTGGFDLRKLTRVSAIQTTGLVQERDSDQFAEFELTLELDLRYVTSGRPPAIRPYRIAGLHLRPIRG